MDMKIDKASPMPIYFQIVEELKSRISSGELKPRGRLPSEMELAKEVGVSPMTVRQAYSHMVNEGMLYRRHGKGTFVSEDPFPKKVAEFQKTGVDFGVLLFDLRSSLAASDDAPGGREATSFSTGLLVGLERACAAKRVRMHVLSVNGKSIQGGDNVVIEELLAKRRMDGLILLGPPMSGKDVELLLSLNIPLVAVDGDYGRPDVPTVLIDDSAFPRLAVKRLAAEGAERILLATGPLYFSGEGRKVPRRGARLLEGFKAAAAAAGLKPSQTRSVECERDILKIERQFKELLSSGRRPEAILTDGDTIAVGVGRALSSLGIMAGSDVKVLSFADSRFSLFGFMAKPMERMAETAVEMLCRLTKDVPVSERRVVLPLDENDMAL